MHNSKARVLHLVAMRGFVLWQQSSRDSVCCLMWGSPLLAVSPLQLQHEDRVDEMTKKASLIVNIRSCETLSRLVLGMITTKVREEPNVTVRPLDLLIEVGERRAIKS